MRASLVLAALLLPALLLPASSGGAPKAGLGRFLLVYATCDSAPCSGGSTQRLAQSADGIRWMPVPSFAPVAGTSPSAVRRGKRLYVLDSPTASPDGISADLRHFSLTASGLSELAPTTVSVSLDTPADAQTATAITSTIAVDRSGALVILFTLRFEPGTKGCAAAKACVKVRTATEVTGSDGADFTSDAGDHAVLSFAPADAVAGPSVFLDAKGVVVLLSGPGSCLHALVGTDLHGSYRGAPGLNGGCIAAQVAVGTPSGLYRPLLAEYVLYGVSGGKVVRAVARSLKRPVPPTRFRPLAGLEGTTVSSARFVPNTA